MELDVAVERSMPVPAEQVAAVMFDPTQDQTWMQALTAVDVLDQPIAIGARVRRHARFMGKDISWITVVRAYEPGARLELDIADGPFVGVVTYEIEPAGSSSTVRIRERRCARAVRVDAGRSHPYGDAPVVGQGPATPRGGRHRLGAHPNLSARRVGCLHGYVVSEMTRRACAT